MRLGTHLCNDEEIFALDDRRNDLFQGGANLIASG